MACEASRRPLPGEIRSVYRSTMGGDVDKFGCGGSGSCGFKGQKDKAKILVEDLGQYEARGRLRVRDQLRAGGGPAKFVGGDNRELWRE